MQIVCAQERELIYDGNQKKLKVEGSSEDIFKLKCKNVSGIDIDVNRNDRLYQEFKECAKDAIDLKQHFQEAKLVAGYIGWGDTNADISLSKQQTFSLIEIFTQKYVGTFLYNSLFYSFLFTSFCADIVRI